jgi:hypothetical protein
LLRDQINKGDKARYNFPQNKWIGQMADGVEYTLTLANQLGAPIDFFPEASLR